MVKLTDKITVNDLKFWHNDLEAIIVIVVVLLILGGINVFSSSFVSAENDYSNPYFYIQSHVRNLMISLALAGFCAWFDYHRWGNLIPLISIGLLVTLILVLIVGQEINGAKRWLNFGISFQPAEFAKLFCLVIAAKNLEYNIKRGIKATLLSKPVLILFTFACLIEFEPDLGTAAIVFGIPVLMALILVGLPWHEIIALIFLGVGGAIFLVIFQPYRLARLEVWFDPFADAQGVGYQAVRSLTAIGSGGFWGMGLGEGVSKSNYFYLPEAHTDFAFAIFSQENGYLMVLLVFFLFAALTFFMLRIAISAKDVYGQLLTVGIMLLIVGQATANMLMVSGVLPVIGIPLPFISYGGSSLMVSLAGVGILLNIAHQSERDRVEKARKMRIEQKAAMTRNRASLHSMKY